MKATRSEIAPALEIPEATIRTVDWGGMTIESGAIRGRLDPSAFFKGLPDDRCQCPHWGYVIKGTLRYNTARGEEVFNAGDVYYVGPGHTPLLEADTEYIELSPTDELAKTMAVVERNFTAAMGGQS